MVKHRLTLVLLNPEKPIMAIMSSSVTSSATIGTFASTAIFSSGCSFIEDRSSLLVSLSKQKMLAVWSIIKRGRDKYPANRVFGRACHPLSFRGHELVCLLSYVGHCHVLLTSGALWETWNGNASDVRVHGRCLALDVTKNGQYQVPGPFFYSLCGLDATLYRIPEDGRSQVSVP